MWFSKRRWMVLLIMIMVPACTAVLSKTAMVPESTPSPASPQPSPFSPTPSSTPSPVPSSTAPDNTLIRVRLTTSSDWTILSLVRGATMLEHTLITASEEISGLEMDSERFILEQPLNRAESGNPVEVTTETLFYPWGKDQPVVIKIERGDLGFTELEFSRLINGEWTVIRTISWGGVTEGENAYRIKLPAAQLFSQVPTAEQPAGPALAPEPVQPVRGMPQGTDGFPWWNDSVFYEIFVRSFYDSDGDGIGDLNGITQKLDYLNDGDPDTTSDLGITGIWLMPIYPSPTYHGYNITDYTGVNPEYGTLEDLQDLVQEAHRRGIRVILDFMVGQTSNQHPWFIQSLNPESPYRDWYIWSDHNPGYTGSWGQQVWFNVNGSYLYSTYSANSPDLNLTNPEVNEEIREAIRFWLEEIGVDGFRLDSAKHVIEEGPIQANSEATHTWWKNFRPFFKAIHPQALMIGEIWEHTSINAEYLQGDEFDLSFEFSLAYEIIRAIKEEDAGILTEQVVLSYSMIPPLQFSTFLTNHDQDRLMDQLGCSPEKVKLAASLLMTAPGVPFIYYGEEIGLEGQGPHELIRRPMQWSADATAGFSAGIPWQPPGPGWQSVNVASQTSAPDSILAHYRELIHARRDHAALRVGDLHVVTTNHHALYSILRVSQEEAVLVLSNLSGKAVPSPLLALPRSSLPEGIYLPTPLLEEGSFPALEVNGGGGFSAYTPLPEVPGYETLILQLRTGNETGE